MRSDQNRDAQMRGLLINELEINPSQLCSVLHFNGDPISAAAVFAGIADQLDIEAANNTQSERESASN